jgi:Fe-S oxidoreductase
MRKKMFAPGCALILYKPELVLRLHSLLIENIGKMDLLTTCCHHDPNLKQDTQIVNICPGCDKRFRSDYRNSSTISLWEILAESDFFPFPDYQNQSMTIIDACPTRDQVRVHRAIRKIVRKMNINLVEPKNTGTKSTCCGDSFYGAMATEKVKELMIKKSSEMPLNDVIVYCVSCSKSMFIGKKQPHYILDLLFSEQTVPKTYEPDDWHRELNDFMEKH